MINKMRNCAVAASLFLSLLPLALAQITPNIWKDFIGEPVLMVTPSLIDYSYAGYKNGAVAIPETFTQPVFNVNDYGATPNDNASDTAGIKAALSAANASSQGGIVFFAAGQYDIFLDSETAAPFTISRDNVIIQDLVWVTNSVSLWRAVYISIRSPLVTLPRRAECSSSSNRRNLIF